MISPRSPWFSVALVAACSSQPAGSDGAASEGTSGDGGVAASTAGEATGASGIADASSGAIDSTAGDGSTTTGPDLPDACPVSGPEFTYEPNGSVGPYPLETTTIEGYRVIALSDGRPEVDESTWIAGNGTWADGDSGGSFATLAGLVAGIGDGGGWALVPDTAITPLLPPMELYSQIYGEWSAHVRGTQGPMSLLRVWGGGAWDGQSFVMGAGGGHFAYWGNEMYRVRLTDPPAAVRMFDPAPMEAIGCGNPDCPSGEVGTLTLEWGPRASHTYDTWRYSPVTNTFFLSGANHSHIFFDDAGIAANRPYISEFDPRAPTPKSATKRWYLGPDQAALGNSVDSAKLLPDDVTYVAFNVNTQSAAVFDLCTKAWRAPVDSEAAGLGYPTAWGPTCRYADDGRFFGIGQVEGAFELDDFSTGTTVYRPLPTWVSNSQDYLDGGPGMVIVGNRAVLWGSTGEVLAIDIDAGTLETFTPQGVAPTRESEFNGVFGRWAWVPEVGAFVGYANLDEGAWVFAPPASWGLGG